MFQDLISFPDYAVMNLSHLAAAVVPVMTNRQGTVPEGAWSYVVPGQYLYTVPTGPFVSGKTFFAYMNGLSYAANTPPFSFNARRTSSTVVTFEVMNSALNDLADIAWSSLSFWIVVFK